MVVDTTASVKYSALQRSPVTAIFSSKDKKLKKILASNFSRPFLPFFADDTYCNQIGPIFEEPKTYRAYMSLLCFLALSHA
jgi:hypothetical protein